MVHLIWSILVMLGTWKEYILCFCLMKCFINVDVYMFINVLLVDSVVEFFYIFADVLSSCHTNCWRMLKSPTIIVNWAISPSSSISFYFLYFSACCVLHAHLGLLYLFDELTLFIIIKCPSLSLTILNVLSCLW